MRISKKSEYALRALIEIGLNFETNQKIGREQISQKQKIPLNFLAHILVSLRNASLITSNRGAIGGYQLSRHPKEISLSEVLKLFEYTDNTLACCNSPTQPCANCPHSPEICPFPQIFNKINADLYNLLDKYSIQDFINQIEKGYNGELGSWVI